MIGPYETRVCDWCQQPVGECECDGGNWDDDFNGCGSGVHLVDCDHVWQPAVVTIDTGGLT